MTFNIGIIKTSSIIDITSMFISIFAILVSIYALHSQKKQGRASLQLKFCEKHFEKALNEDIPTAMGAISFADENINGIEELMNVLSDIRIKADFFRYASPKFYKKFKTQNQCIEDFLADSKNRKHDADRQEKFRENLNKKMEKLYGIICEEYFG